MNTTEIQKEKTAAGAGSNTVFNYGQFLNRWNRVAYWVAGLCFVIGCLSLLNVCAEINLFYKDLLRLNVNDNPIPKEALFAGMVKTQRSIFLIALGQALCSFLMIRMRIAMLYSSLILIVSIVIMFVSLFMT